jgi:GntR family transcriptional repressor for pyruvate dehydrogenase complex
MDLLDAADRPMDVRDLAGWIAERWILSGAVPPGQQLPSERVLAQSLGVGRPLVREAIKRLLERRLVDVQPGRGTFVRHLQTTDAADPLTALVRDRKATAADVLQARIMLETEAARVACRSLTIESTRRIRAALQRFEDADTLEERVRTDRSCKPAATPSSGSCTTRWQR